MICLNCHAAELELKQDGTFWWCSQCNRAFTVEAVAEIERLRQGILAASHLLFGATGPEGGPTSWSRTLEVWRALFDRDIAEAAKEQGEE